MNNATINKDSVLYKMLNQHPLGDNISECLTCGAEILTAQKVVGVRVEDLYKIVSLDDGTELTCRALILASGFYGLTSPSILLCVCCILTPKNCKAAKTRNRAAIP